MTGEMRETPRIVHRELSARLRQHLPFARAECQALPDEPSLSLYLLNADFPQHELTAEQMSAVLNYPAYWAFCWASGQVLARFLRERPEWVRGRRVMDFSQRLRRGRDCRGAAGRGGSGGL